MRKTEIRSRRFRSRENPWSRSLRDRVAATHERVTPLQGSCLCGGVRFEVTEPFTYTTHCHCEFCKRISGGYGTVSGRTSTSAIRVLQGGDLLRSYTPEGGSAKSFCSVCGSNLFGGGWPESESSSVRLAAFGLEYDRKPEAHTFVRSVAAWEILPDDGLPRYDVRAT